VNVNSETRRAETVVLSPKAVLHVSAFQDCCCAVAMGLSTVDRAIEYIIINYRWVFVCLFLLPASLLYEIYNYGRNWIVVKLNSAPKQHDRKVKNVQKQVSKISVLRVHIWFVIPPHILCVSLNVK
jgi:hypothetical protein